MSYLWYALGFFALIVIGTRIATVLALRRLRLRAPRFRAAAEDEIPPALRTALAEARDRLAPSGFAAAGWAVGWGPDSGEERAQRFALAANAAGDRMLLCAHLLPEAGMPWMVSFASPLPAGRWLLTPVAARHLIYGELPSTVLPAARTAVAISAATGWAQHTAALAEHARGPAPAGHEEFLARLAAAWSTYPQDLIAAGLAIPASDALARPTLAGAWRTAGAVQRGAGAVQGRLLAAQRAGQAEPVPAAVEIEAALRHDARRADPGPGGLRGLLMILGAAVFLAVSGSQSAHWWQGVILLGVLLLHEAGHLVAMLLCGYRDTAIFFLPMLGAITTGEKRDASVTQQAVVSLAGPLPGVVIGTAMLLCGVHDEMARFAAFCLLALNLFNLLPLMPLDGGQLVHRLLLARVPWLDVAARTLAVAALAVLGWVEPIMLAVAVFLGFALPLQWIEAGFAKACLRDPALAGLDREALLAAIATRITAHPALARRPWAQRWSALRTTAERLLHAPPSTGTLIGLLLAWLFALLLPPVILVLAALIRQLAG